MISNPVQGKAGGSGGYTKVNAVSKGASPSFAYRPPDGGGTYPIRVNGNLPETPCQPGSVFVMGGRSDGALSDGYSAGIRVSIEGDTLVLTAGVEKLYDSSGSTDE